MPSAWYLLPPVAALIGWVTNFIAVRMIFRPYRPIRCCGLTIQGLLPKRRAEFAKSIGETVEEHLVTPEDIKKLLDDPSVKERLDELVRRGVDEFIEKKLTSINPMVATFLSGALADKIKSSLVEQLGSLLGRGVQEIGSHLDENLDLQGIVERKILDFDMRSLEQIVLRVAKNELRGIEFLGAVLGFVVGCGQLALLALLD